MPPSIIEKGLISDALLTDILLKKYCEHMPLYRQAASLWRDAGIELSQSTMSASVLKAGALLGSICEAMRKDLLSGGYIQADETTVPVQSKRSKGKNHQAYFWQYGRPGGPVVYEFRTGREREGPKNWLADFGGRLQTDGYSAYDKIGAFSLLYFGCWAHARRRFFEASKVNPKDARSVAIVVQIEKLYALEAKARELGLSFEEREALRLEHAVPVLATIKAMVIEARAAMLPKGPLGKACTYAINQWERLERYAGAGNGCVEIDNNIAENGMRGVALGRNYAEFSVMRSSAASISGFGENLMFSGTEKSCISPCLKRYYKCSCGHANRSPRIRSRANYGRPSPHNFHGSGPSDGGLGHARTQDPVLSGERWPLLLPLGTTGNYAEFKQLGRPGALDSHRGRRDFVG